MANIGIDVDGVLRNLGKFQLEHGKKFFKNANEQNIDLSKIDIKEIFGCSEDESKEFWKKHFLNYCLFEPMVDNASDIINFLQKEGNKIHIITQHANTLRNDAVGILFRGMLKSFFEKNNITPDTINYCDDFGKNNDKLVICKKLNIDFMIEDNPINIEKISAYCRVIGIKTSYNNDKNFNDNVLMVDSFSDVYNAIKYFDEIKNGQNIAKINFYKDKHAKTYNKVRLFGVPIFKTMLNPTIINKDLIPNDGPILLCGNHLHVWDQFPVICATSRVTHWMSKKEYFDSRIGPFFEKTGAICVDRYGDASTATNEALNYLKIGSAVGLFPEGTRNGLKDKKIEELYEYVPDCELDSFKNNMKKQNPLLSQINLLEKLYEESRISKDFFINSLYDVDNYLKSLLYSNIISEDEYFDSQLLPFKFGAVSMAHKANATIVPFGVTGDYKIGNKNLTVRFGEPFKVVDDDLENANLELRHKVLNLILENKKNVSN